MRFIQALRIYLSDVFGIPIEKLRISPANSIEKSLNGMKNIDVWLVKAGICSWNVQRAMQNYLEEKLRKDVRIQ